MTNPFNVLNTMNQPSSDIKQMYQAFSQSNNPMQMFMQMAGQNPQLQPIVNALRSGGNPQQIFNQICSQRGINPQEFLNNLTK